MAKDFFDEEFEKTQKVEQPQQQQTPSADSWYNRPAPAKADVKSNKKVYIAVICIALVVCIAFGWSLCAIFQSIVFNYNTDKAISDDGGAILNTVIKYLKNKYYADISDEDWLDAIEYSGTALMQVAGDKFSQLMAPQTYYDLLYPRSSLDSNTKVFGFSLVVEEGVGLYISSVVANSNSYGKLQSGDIVLKLTDMRDEEGKVPTYGGKSFEQLVVGEWKSEVVQEVLKITHKAKFQVLRLNGVDNEQGFEVFTVELERGELQQVDSDYKYNFIEFYFDSDHRNISVPSQMDDEGNYVITEGEYTTYEERHLDQLPVGTGYVRITQFMDVTTIVNGKENTVTASDEFKEVMTLFTSLGYSRLVLDLKGNPGGNVAYVSDIAGMLVTDAKLTDAERAKVVNKNGELLITTLIMPKLGNYAQKHTRVSTYKTYFGNPTAKCSIVVWTDSGSASASELLTGALLDYRTAVQMGTTTYGKGIAQTWEELPFYGSVTTLTDETISFPWAIYYTCASYYSPLGLDKTIHGVGFTPDEGYNGLTDYADLWSAANNYWN